MMVLSPAKQTTDVRGRELFFYGHGQVGFSVHFPDDPTEIILGAPGVFNWQGESVRSSYFPHSLLPIIIHHALLVKSSGSSWFHHSYTVNVINNLHHDLLLNLFGSSWSFHSCLSQAALLTVMSKFMYIFMRSWLLYKRLTFILSKII